MENLGLYPKLTKKYILDRISQEDIMQRFLGFPVDNNTLSANSINSPYRVDNNASCNYYYNVHGKVRFKDHTTKVNYDCFDVVARSLGISSNSKLGFIEILHEIAKAFRINKYEHYSEVLNYEQTKNKHTKVTKTKRLVQYKVTLRPINYHDKSYWGQAGLGAEDLKGVFFIQEIRVSYNNSSFKYLYSYNPKDPCYGYYGGKDKIRRINLWKFYFPLRIKGDDRGTRFTSNGAFMQGLQYLKPDRVCVVTKAFKDAKVFNKIGLQSCALSAETVEPTPEEAFYLKSMFDYVITCLDFDRTGITMARILRTKYNFKPLMFTNGYSNTIDYEAKDAFEFCTNNNPFILKTIVKEIYLSNEDLIKQYTPKLIIF
tara:strand:- start:38610 stop:39725 length:1116 start_codon:yes stop_codon:yes gene_type:complete